MAEALSDRSWLAAMLAFEAALARAEADVGVIPAESAEVIASCCKADLYDIAEIGRRTTLAGNPATPLVAMLTAKVREKDPAAAEFVHYGATSQDVIDTALGQLVFAARMLIDQRVSKCCEAAAHLANKHRLTVMPGRTLLQQALPTSFGLKAGHWLSGLMTSFDRLFCGLFPRLQFGGAAGTLASLGDNAAAVINALEREISVNSARAKIYASGGELIWHTNRQEPQQAAAQFGILCSTLGKIARDIALLMQTEVAEVFEPSAPGKGGSSTLPHKRNPVQTTAIIAIATRTPGLVATMLSAGLQEHERGVGGWHAEWDTMRELLLLTGAAALHMQNLLEGLEVDTERMRANLELTNGLIMAERLTFALAPGLGKAKAKSFMEAACRQALAEKRHLKDLLREAPEAAALDLDTLFDPATYLGASDAVIDRILALYEDEKEYMSEDKG
ncbi:MAG: 3-carboxy-cis,cis-muconate cycloisomerase [Methylocystis sp.]|nr:3-carboxy-cis,cis-muconate cycloisomerase [Methylocystis sp.]MCA3584278.1 3-carboxy-cis,cis-muconate cycloisomerase [Methylocystis sp.]MCA3588310.1 3-carboxy-cis,cis-muconate cycloisomerase [Methylocystis sp.]MCA3590937.1 3-carboxy-cis,cis-muconate cycloisomerase [Methylocystis sp.]